MTNFKNLTPHTLTVANIVVPPSGTIARVFTVETQVSTVDIMGISIPVMNRRFGTVEGLPPPEEGIIYLVSSMVLDSLKGSGRTDVYAPDAGNTAVRDENGRIIGTVRLIAVS